MYQSNLIAALLLLATMLAPSHLLGDEMSDYDAIKITIFNYFDGFRTKDRARLEKAFAVDVGHMKGYLKAQDGSYQLSVRPMNEVIDDWVSRDTNPDMSGELLDVNIYSEVAAMAMFDFNGIFIDAFQLAKIGGEWRIVNKFYIDK